MEKLISFSGLLVMLVIAFLLSNNRRLIRPRIIVGGIFLQFVFAYLILKTTGGRFFFEKAQDAVAAIISLSDEGAIFLFGDTFSEHFFAFKVLPTIIFVSSISYLLFYWGILQRIVHILSMIMQRTMGISGSESLVTAANVFAGQTEAPMLIKPYIKKMTNSEIMLMMTSGMATVAGGVLAAYVGMGISAGHLLAASLMSAPAAVMIAKIIVPESEISETSDHVKIDFEIDEVNAFEAACKGASEGLKLALNVGAMLIAFIALVALVNVILGSVGNLFGWELSLERILSFVFQPLAFIMGVPWEESAMVGRLLGEKTVINEFLAYSHLSEMIRNNQLSPRSITIATYALCGFANFASVAIQIGGIGALEPSKKSVFAIHGLRSMIGGTLACFMTACIAGIMLD